MEGGGLGSGEGEEGCCAGMGEGGEGERGD